MLNIGVLGAGHLGKIHIKCIQALSEKWNLVGFYDPSDSNAAEAEAQYGVKRYESMDELLDQCDAIDIVTPTLSHHACAVHGIKLGKHVFIEKPVTNTMNEAKNLIKISEEANVQLQVGHVERFNPAFTAAEGAIEQPRFIEAHRLSQFNPRGTDVSVVLDLMIHDIDVILSVVKSNVKNISASGVAVLSDTPDITNARLEFDNGCVANLTASRISLKNMRKSRFFQRDAYISVDFFEKKSEIVRMKSVEGEADPFSMTIDLGGDKGMKEIIFEKPDVQPNNAIQDELAEFHRAITTNTSPKVTIHDGYRALEVAHAILEKLQASHPSIKEMG
ncbi:MAG: Gfo/Idh/MocA family oxidoreductase [Bacteroidota bacterium]